MNKKVIRRKFKEKIPIERDTEFLEQYGRPFSELTISQEDNYSKAIGRFFMYFSSLETALDYMIINIISRRGDEGGYRIIKYLEFRDKINLAKGEYGMLVSFFNKERERNIYKSKLDIIIRKLEEVSEFRNKVAHANWESLDRKGFVRTKIKDSGIIHGVHFEKLKLSPAIIYKFVRQIASLAKNIDSFVETAWQKI